jgi:hypothetical protein
MKFHYYASCVYNWAVADTPASALARLAEDIGEDTIERAVAQNGGLTCFVIKVHAPIEAEYKINFYQPVGVKTSGGYAVQLLNTKGHCTLKEPL